MSGSIVLRNIKLSALTYDELDGNFLYLSQSYLPLSATASLSVTSASYAATSSVSNTASYSQTASYAEGYLPITGGTISGSLTVLGTASISYLHVTFESASVIYSTGSNQFGDASNDTQVLYGTVIISGSQQITGSVTAPDITGSLFGTASVSISSSYSVSSSMAQSASWSVSASYAVSSSQAITASYASSSKFAVTASLSISASYALTASYLSGGIETASYSITASYALTASYLSGSVETASYSLFAVSSSYPFAVTGSSLYAKLDNAGVPNNSSDAIWVGNQAGSGSSVANNSIFIGTEAGARSTSPSFTYNNIAIGTGALKSVTTGSDDNIAIGNSAGQISAQNSTNIYIGNSAGQNQKRGSWNVMIGPGAGQGAATSSVNVHIGFSAGAGTATTRDNVVIGYTAGQNVSNASSSVFIGYSAGRAPTSVNTVGSNNIIIGTNVTLDPGRKDSINIGGLIFGSGSYASNQGIPVSSSANGRIGINQPYPSFSLDVSGSGRFTNGITASLFGTSSWAQNSITASYALTASFLSGSITSASYAATASVLEGTASWSINSISASVSVSASVAISASFAYTASSAISASIALTASFLSGSVVSSSYAYTASSAISASIAMTASFLSGSVSTASYALKSEYPFFVSGTTIASHNAIVQSTDNNFIVGNNAGQSMPNAHQSILIGTNAGRFASGLGNSVFIGENAGQSATNGWESHYIGPAAGLSSTNAYRSIFVGGDAGRECPNANNSIFIGYQAGNNNAIPNSGPGRNNIILGTKVTLAAGAQDCMNIGGTLFGKNFYWNVSGVSISGSVGGSIGINVVDPQYNLDVSGSLRQQNGFAILSQVSASLNFANDTAAAAGGVPLGGLYRNGNVIQIRLV